MDFLVAITNIVIAYFCGALMFSYWLGLAAGVDLKKVGDGNPGAFNLWHAAGFKFGIIGVILDFLKGFLPVFVFAMSGYAKSPLIIPMALAPILGHAFSPFFKFNGGKAIAVTFGVWSGLTGFEVSLVYGIMLAILTLVSKRLVKNGSPPSETDAFMCVTGMLPVFVYMYFRGLSVYWMLAWLLNFLLLIYTNRKKLLFYIKQFHSVH